MNVHQKLIERLLKISTKSFKTQKIFIWNSLKVQWTFIDHTLKVQRMFIVHTLKVHYNCGYTWFKSSGDNMVPNLKQIHSSFTFYTFWKHLNFTCITMDWFMTFLQFFNSNTSQMCIFVSHTRFSLQENIVFINFGQFRTFLIPLSSSYDIYFRRKMMFNSS